MLNIYNQQQHGEKHQRLQDITEPHCKQMTNNWNVSYCQYDKRQHLAYCSSHKVHDLRTLTNVKMTDSRLKLHPTQHDLCGNVTAEALLHLSSKTEDIKGWKLSSSALEHLNVRLNSFANVI